VSMRCGITSGTCAAAAAKAAATVLVGGSPPGQVEVVLPGGQTARVPVLYAKIEAGAATAAVRKDAGDDDDITDGAEILATCETTSGGDDGEVVIVAGEGVGTITKPGLQLPPGEAAINPVPRQMIADAVRQVTRRGLRVEISVPDGRRLAAKTFNPRLGIEGGLSILGTSGIVRPRCAKALRDALRCALDVAAACGVKAPVLVPGNIGLRAARRHFTLADEQVIEAGNAWAFLIDRICGAGGSPASIAGGSPAPQFEALLILGHPGKLAKLAEGHWDTHSSRSPPATRLVAEICRQLLCQAAPESPTVEGIFAALCAEERKRLADDVANRMRSVIEHRSVRLPVAVFLTDMAGQCLGTAGDLSPWQ
jgi:cobalt-precorrin-5B (C1)-methyltransferase